LLLWPARLLGVFAARALISMTGGSGGCSGNLT
jgi:hypothetical protein